MKKFIQLFAILAMAMGIAQGVKAQQQYDGYIDTLNNRLYYRVTDTATVVIVPPTEEWSKEEGESDYSWKNWKGYTQPSGFVLIPDSITTWNGLVHGTLPVVAIESRTFYNCTGITSVKIPETVKDIMEAAFESCTALVTANMPNSVTRLGSAAFYNCIKLKNCHISEGLTRIPSYAFMNDSSMRTLIIHENLTSFGENAFSSLGTLDSLFYMPNTRSSTDYFAFSYTPTVYLYTNTDSYMGALDVIELGDNIDTLYNVAGGRLLNNEGVEEGPGDLYFHLKKIIVGSGVKHITKSAFMHVDHLDTLVMKPATAPTRPEEPIFETSQLDSVVVVTPCDAEYYKTWGFEQYTYFGNHVHFLYTWDGAYTLNLRTDNREQGTAQYVTSVNCDQEISFKAVPAQHYHFVRWSDGSTDSVRTITLTQDSSLTAFFAIDQHTVTIHSADSTMGSVTGSGVYDWGEDVEISATANPGHHFSHWNDKYTTHNPNKTIFVESDSVLTAFFERNEYHAYTYVAHYSFYGTAEVDNNQPLWHDTITFTATPSEGMHFVGWSYNGEIVSTENPFKVVVESDTTLGAEFAYGEPEAIAEANGNNAQIFGSNQRIVINNAANANVAIYDVMGREVVKEQRINSNNEIFAMPQRGMYIVRMGKAAKKVFVK